MAKCSAVVDRRNNCTRELFALNSASRAVLGRSLAVQLRKIILAGAACVALLAGSAGAQTPSDSHPDFSGLWQCRVSCGNGVLIPRDQVQMTPEGQRLYAQKKAGVDSGDPAFDTGLQCHPLGIPRLAMFGTFQILQTKEAVGVIGEWLGPPRLIYFDTQHRKNYFPSFMGDAIAHWEGNNLVVDSENFDEETLLDSSGFPHSDQLHFEERWTLSPDGKTITSQWTLTDPQIFKIPYKKTVVYARKNIANPVERVTENVCQNIEVGGKKT